MLGKIENLASNVYDQLMQIHHGKVENRLYVTDLHEG
jgi:hypothetical protein